ncbi:MAG: preprotein translocase subunit SecA [Bacteroidetes bacterium HGW-Bacteroidetes-16]|jgi:preprotein translocase subunit SecA|nr:MAG: preprotein translocase subunit SecA [Bacteroidetes bacterium HGW-Bacteroidetes-16]
MINFIKKLLGDKATRDLKAIGPEVEQVKAAYEKIKHLSNDELRAKTTEFKQRIKEYIAVEENEIDRIKQQINDQPDIDTNEKEELYITIDKLIKVSYEKTEEVLNQILPEAFSVMKETARRFKENEVVEVTANEMDGFLATKLDSVNIKGDKAYYRNQWLAGGNTITWDMVHYDVQLFGGTVLHHGKIAEMATGEGKTLVATLPVYLNALPGKGVHLVTVNDYLAKRDGEWMGMLYQFHGLKVDCIDYHQPNSKERRMAYLADITFGTNNEFGFDYLRDNMTGNPEEMVQRGHNYVIVDEVDSVLIDDARTPLIISGPTPKGDLQEFDALKADVQSLYNAQKTLVSSILAEIKNLFKDQSNNENVKNAGLLLLRAYHGLPKNTALIKLLSEEGNRQLMQKTESFFLQEQAKNMHVVDDELFFAIDEKHNSVDLTEKGIDLLTRSYDDAEFFILPDIGSVVADLEKQNIPEKEKLEKKSELIKNYAIKSERVHTVTQLLKAYTLFEKDVEYVIIENKIKIVDEQTGRIMEGRRYSDGLHQAIEAKENVKVEAATQTYATITLQNYFRMYNKLAGMTGTAETEAGELWDIYKLDVVVIPTNKPIIRDDRQDLVYKTKREKYNAIIDEIEQLTKKNRPVLVGTTSVEISELLSRMLTRKHIHHNVLNAKLHQKEAQVVKEAGHAGMVTIATNMAGRGTDIKLGEGVVQSGGLAIIGTERHDSRRVDRQLRGRAGRQGDPGSSQFFVSLEDDLMRMFGSGRIAGIMDRLGLDEGEVIQHSMITKSIERAQKKVEENNFGIRKRLLEYDDVMNSQREVIYKRRRHALFGERLSVDVSNMIYDLCENIIIEYQENRDYDGFKLELYRTLAVESPFNEATFSSESVSELTDQLFEVVYKAYIEKRKRLAISTLPVIKDVYENQSQFENIAIPFSDGIRQVQVIANLRKSVESNGTEVPLAFEKGISLSHIDDAWKEQLREMDDLKQSVQNASYEQKDPLLIYKFESFELFKKMIQKINKDVVSYLIKGDIFMQNQSGLKEAKLPKGIDRSQIKEEHGDMLSQAHSNTQDHVKPQPVKVEKKVGRNDLCPCGSGKKYKQCHGKHLE